MERTELPIAVFDSGLGGISVLRALVQRLPGDKFFQKSVDNGHKL